MSDTELEAAIVATNPPGPRVTPAQIEGVIAGEHYLQPLGTTLTICILVLRNGFTVTGESACADPANFNQEIGQRIARDNAKAKIWALEGYLLRERLHLSDGYYDAAAKAIIEGDAIVIRVPFANLQAAVLGGWAAGVLPAIRIDDAAAFANAMLPSLNREGEDGTTPIHRLLDQAIEGAFEDGAGDEIDDDEAELLSNNLRVAKEG